jgi:hypothetical protein
MSAPGPVTLRQAWNTVAAKVGQQTAKAKRVERRTGGPYRS